MAEDAAMQNAMNTQPPTLNAVSPPHQDQLPQQPAEPFPSQPAADSPAPPLMNIHADIDMTDAVVNIYGYASQTRILDSLICHEAFTSSSTFGDYTYGAKDGYPS